MHTVRLFRPLHHERWCWLLVLHGKSLELRLHNVHITWRLVSDVWRGPSSPPWYLVGNDVASQGLLVYLDFPEVQVCSTALF